MLIYVYIYTYTLNQKIIDDEGQQNRGVNMTTTPDKKTTTKKSAGGKRKPDANKLSGEEVGIAFLLEFIRVYQGHSEDTIPDEKRSEMVAALTDQDDLTYSPR